MQLSTPPNLLGSQPPQPAAPSASVVAPPTGPAPTQPTLPRPELAQTNPAFKKATDLKYEDANFLPVGYPSSLLKYLH